MATIESLREEFGNIVSRQEALIHELSDHQLRWQPEAARWSILDCIGHINSTGEAYTDRLNDALNDLPPRSDAVHDLRYSFTVKILTRMMEPPVKMRSKTMAAYEPQTSGEAAKTIAAFHAVHEQFSAILQKLENVGTPRRKVASPVLSVLKMRVPAWLAFLAAHERRHLWQAENVRAHPGFPEK